MRSRVGEKEEPRSVSDEAGAGRAAGALAPAPARPASDVTPDIDARATPDLTSEGPPVQFSPFFFK